MKAYPLNARARKEIERQAKEYANAERNDIATRSTYLVLLACMQAGLSARTMRRIINELPKVTEAYAEYKTERLGDVAWYLAVSAHCIGYTLEDVFRMNVTKLRKRYPNGFEAERSVNRENGDI